MSLPIYYTHIGFLLKEPTRWQNKYIKNDEKKFGLNPPSLALSISLFVSVIFPSSFNFAAASYAQSLMSLLGIWKA